MAPLLLDLAVLYRALAFGADGDLDPAEVDAMRVALEAWAPGEDPASVDHALREASLVDARRETLTGVLNRVRGRLDVAGRTRVLADLKRVARADGRVVPGEQELIVLVEKTFSAEP